MNIGDALTAAHFADGRRGAWVPYLQGEFDRPYMRSLRECLAEEESDYGILPPPEHVFEALDETTPEDVKIVIIGQDPYYVPGQAHGLAFSALGPTRPKSLSNILAEVEGSVTGSSVLEGHNCLTPWARQGVLLLNRALTVRRGCAGKHLTEGWKCFTDKVIETINRRERIVFMLWGEKAREVGRLIRADRHEVLCARHPAIGLRGSGHFSQANEYLEERQVEPIDWLDVCHRPQLEAQDAADPLTSADAEDEARWDRAFANSTSQLDQLAAQAREERRLGQTEELDPSRL